MCKVYYKSGMTLCVPRSFSCHFEMLNVWTKIFFLLYICAREFVYRRKERAYFVVLQIYLLMSTCGVLMSHVLWWICAQGPLEHACLHRYYVHRADDWRQNTGSPPRINYGRDTNGTNSLISHNETRKALTEHTYLLPYIQHIVTIQNTCVMNWMNVNIKSYKCY